MIRSTGLKNFSYMTAERQTKQKLLIRYALEKSNTPLSAKEIFSVCQQRIPDINKTTVYRELERLVASRQLDVVSTIGNRAILYELTSDPDHHHHHFHCTACDALSCLAKCTLNFEKMVPQGFQAVFHEVTIHGICKDCC